MEGNERGSRNVIGLLERKQRPLKPKVEQAMKMYALGHFATQAEAAAYCGISETRFGSLCNSPEGQKVFEGVRAELELKYGFLYQKFVQVVSDALDHADPAVALAAANLYAKTQIGQKVRVELSAEDIVQQIMNGTYQG